MSTLNSNEFYADVGSLRKQGGEFSQQADKLENGFNALQRLQRRVEFSQLSAPEADDLRSLLLFAENGLNHLSDKGNEPMTYAELYSLKVALNEYAGFTVKLDKAQAGKVGDLLKCVAQGLQLGFVADDFC